MTFGLRVLRPRRVRRAGVRRLRPPVQRAARDPGRRLVAAAGLMAGLAVCFEYPLGLLAASSSAIPWRDGTPLAARRHLRRRRGRRRSAGSLYNLWSLGSPLRFAYSDAVAVPGRSGHAVLGLNSDGFFGITAPRPGAAVDLLLPAAACSR